MLFKRKPPPTSDRLVLNGALHLRPTGLRREYDARLIRAGTIRAMGDRPSNLSIPAEAAIWGPPKQAAVSTLENEHLCQRFDTESGWLTSLYDKDGDDDLLSDAGGVPVG